MRDSSYNTLNWNQVLLSQEESGWNLRLGYRSESTAERSLLLTTDSLGFVADARNVSLMKDPSIDWVFNGRIEISKLNGNLISSNTVTNGYIQNDRVRQPGNPSVNSTEEMFLVPAAQELPEVVVIGYYDASGGGGLSLGDYLYLSGLSGGAGVGAGSGAGAGPGGSSGGSSSGAGGNNGGISGVYAPLRPAGAVTDPATRVISSRPTTINIETSYSKPGITSYSKPGINLAAYLKCFSTIPDAGASYTASLFVDLPINDDPTQIFNQVTGAVGHCFLGLTKTGSSQSVAQYFGFASTQPFSAIVGTVTPGKVVDNTGHKYNASLSIPVNAGQFGIAMNKISSLSGSNYDLNKFNCVDFALSVINSFRPTTPIIPAIAQMPGGGLSIDTPQGLYITLQHIQNTGGAALIGSIWNAGASHGACN